MLVESQYNTPSIFYTDKSPFKHLYTYKLS